MKTLLLFAASLSAIASLAAPAFADGSGSVTVSGSVASKCSDVGATPVTLDVGELAQTNDQVVATFTNSGNTHANFSIVCNTAAPVVTVVATPLTGPANPPTGYTNLVQYKATVTPYLVGSVANPFLPYTWTDNTSTSHPTYTLSGPLSTALNNVQVDISTPYSNGFDLVAGAYSGTVTVTITPS